MRLSKCTNLIEPFRMKGEFYLSKNAEKQLLRRNKIYKDKNIVLSIFHWLGVALFFHDMKESAINFPYQLDGEKALKPEYLFAYVENINGKLAIICTTKKEGRSVNILSSKENLQSMFYDGDGEIFKNQAEQHIKKLLN